MAVIVINSITIGLETAVHGASPMARILHLLDHIALAVFVGEIAIKIPAMGPRRFFSSGWNVFDFLVVAVALVPGAGPLSVLRTLRILRLLRVIKFLPSLRRVVEALMLSLPGISAIAVLMLMIFYVAAVMSTAMFGQAFPDWFGSLGKSLYTLFQIMTLESWSMGIVRPVMEHSPWAWAFFVPFILVSAFTMLNLFVAVIVDTMGQMDAAGQEETTDPQQDEAAGTAPAQSRPGEGPDTPVSGAGASHPAREEILKTNPEALAGDEGRAPARLAPTSPGTGEGLTELLAEMRALRAEVAALRAQHDDGAPQR
ncbi:ion transporter [Actinomyces bowdenii]|uniref:Ion transporter n=2 Tax=Actinomyces bowdenii TaxID=131109 RepID=A0A3P1VBM6_9ACTO|nr:ion transporter [Actinomyces bowdenii]